MAYQVIARKWRPQTFEEVTGQEHITKTLINSLSNDRLHHSYVFAGTRGVGKTTTARLLAKAVNCHSSPTPTATPCRDELCLSCTEIIGGRSIDVLEIDAATNTGVDAVKETIVSGANYVPVRDRYKVFIIDEVHMLTTASFNALLKTVEEPGPQCLFIMATTEHHKIPKTILSRSQQFTFRAITVPKIVERLRHIAKEEFLLVGDDALREIARAGHGSMRDAQSAFDQVLSYAGEAFTKEEAVEALGMIGSDVLVRAVEGLAAGNQLQVLGIVEELVSNGYDLNLFCLELLTCFRDLLFTKAGVSSEILESSVCTHAERTRLGTMFGDSDLVRMFHCLAETDMNMKKAARPQYILEVGLAKLMEIRDLTPITTILEKLNVMEAGHNGR